MEILDLIIGLVIGSLLGAFGTHFYLKKDQQKTDLDIKKVSQTLKSDY